MMIRDEVDAISVGFARCLAERDAERIAAFYTDDARLLVPGQPIIRGRAEIKAIFREWFKDGPVIARFETDEVIVDGALVVEIGHTIGPTGREKYVVIYQRQPDGSLKIAVDAENDDGPQVAPG